MGLYRKVTINGVEQLQSLAGANASGTPASIDLIYEYTKTTD